MAEIPRLQAGRVQVQGVSNLPQPNMNFGQRQPQVEFQAAAENTSLLSRTLSNLSTQMFGMAQSMADDAGARFAAENPVTQEELQAMADGNTEKFKREVSLNAFGAAVNKFRATEISSYLESQLIKDANDLQLRIETGKNGDGSAYDVDVTKISSDWRAKSDGYSASLATVSPDAAYKLRATAAVHGNRVLLAAAKAQNQKALAQAKVYIVKDVEEYANTVRNILNGERSKDATGKILGFQDSLLYERQRLLNGALTRGGIDGQTFAFEQSDKIEFEVKTAVFENAVLYRKGDLGGDLVSFNDKIKNRTLPDDLQTVWDSMTLTQQKSARDKIVSQYQQLIDIKNKDREFDKQDNVISANRLKLTYLDPNSSEETRQDIISQLKEISAKYPEILDAKTIHELPKLLKETAEDDYGGVAKLTQRLREKDATLTTTPAILEAAKGLGVTPKTALELSERYLPKDAKEGEKLKKTLEIEYLLRTKKPDPFIKKPISTLDDLKNSLELRGLSLADASSNYIQLLKEAAEADTSSATYGRLLNAITRNEITEPLQVISYMENNKLVADKKTVDSLMERVEFKQRQFQQDISRDAKDMARLYGTSPKSTAKLEYKFEREIPEEIDRLVKEWQDNGSKGPRPGRKEATDNLVKKQDNSISQKRIIASNEAINKMLSDNGLTFANITSRSGDIFTTNSGPVIVIRPEYQEHLRKELGKKIKSPSALDAAVNNIMQNLIIIEQEQRNIR